MATRDEALDYKIWLTDRVKLAQYQTALLPGQSVPGQIIMGPGNAAVAFSAPILSPHQAFVAPSIQSEWFADGNNFPTDVARFSRKSGGWFGISWLFGNTVNYTWVGELLLAPGPQPGVVGTADPISQRRWIDGFESPGTGLGGVDFPARAASRHVSGHGLMGQGNTVAASHTVNEYAVGLAPARSWERFYLRPCVYPTVNENVWKASGSVESNTGLVLGLTTLGQLTVSVSNNIGTLTLIGTAGTPLALHEWARVDVLVEFGATAQAKVYLNGTLQLTITSITPGTGMGTAGRTHTGSTLGGPSTGVLHYDDWICADWPPFLNGLDWVNGSKITRLPVTGFDAGLNNWTGDYRFALQSPGVFNGMGTFLSAVSGGRLGLALDTDQIDTAPNALGVVAAIFSVFGYKGNTLNGAVTGSFQAGAITFGGTAVQTAFPPFSYASSMYRPSGLTAALKLGVSAIIHTKAADTFAAKVASFSAVVEVLGLFGDADRPGDAQTLETMGASMGVHNAPYPYSPWAVRGVPPQSPVVLVGGTYVGNGAGQDLLFRVPVHWLQIRPLTGDSGGAHWWSSLLGAHYRTQNGCAPSFLPEACLSRTFVAGSVDEAVSSGDHTDLVQRVKAECVALGLDLSGDCGAFEITKRVAWQLSSTGGGLLDKPTGANCQGYAIDIICYSDGSIYDVLVNAGTDNTPAWQVSGAGAVAPSRYRPPIDPGDVVPPLPAGDGQVQQTVVRVSEPGGGLTNQAGVTYQYIALCDPGMRFLLNGALDGHRGAAAFDVPLVHPGFTAQGGFVWIENMNAATNDAEFYKGPGAAAASMTSIEGSGDIASALTYGAGVLTRGTAFNSYVAQQVAYSLFRRDDGSGDPGVARVVCIQSYVGDGSATRTIALLPPSQRRPLFALIVPHNAHALYRDPSHTGTTSSRYDGTINAATGIIAGGLDSLTVGSVLNATGIVYDMLVFFAGTDACQNGWGCNGEYIPVEPIAPPGPGPWTPPPTPVPIPPTPTPGPGPGGGPPWPATQCLAPSQDLVNRAIARLGESILVTDLANELIPAAIQARLHYHTVLDTTLREFPWPFATRYVTLALVGGTATTPVNADWQYSYRAPADLLFARRFVKATGEKRRYDPVPSAFRMGADAVGPLVYTDLEATGLLLEYTVRVTCAALEGDALFVSAFTWRLAHELATPLTRDKDLAKFCYAMYLQEVDRARIVAANESQQEQQSPDAPWITGRE